MIDSITHIHAKSKAFVDALAGMPRGVRMLTPRGHFARDYNTLRKLALEAAPGLDERFLGKYILVRELASGEEVSEASFVEIEVYARQILEQLALLLAHGHASSSDGESGRSRCGGKLLTQAGKPWGRAEDDALVSEFDAGHSIRELARTHQRTEGAIRSRLMRLGKIAPAPGTNILASSGPQPATSAPKGARVLSDRPHEVHSSEASSSLSGPGDEEDWESRESTIPVRCCAQCGRLIPPERLEAIPEADLCRDCQLGRESGSSNPRMTDSECPRCASHGINSPMVWRTARDPSISGYFLGCSRFPECRYIDRN